MFGIHLHIDDDVTVRQNGVQHGFRVLIIDRDDHEWAGKVLQEALRVKALLKAKI